MNEKELGTLSISRYLTLRLYRKIGTIWETGTICTYSPIGSYLHRNCAEQIPLCELKALIDYWFPLVEQEPELIERRFAGREYYLVRRRKIC